MGTELGSESKEPNLSCILLLKKLAIAFLRGYLKKIYIIDFIIEQKSILKLDKYIPKENEACSRNL